MYKNSLCPISLIWWFILFLARSCRAEVYAYNGGNDLASFVSEPMLRPPRFKISQLDRSKLSPGYWFVAPYVNLHQTDVTLRLEACQIGPHIYDNNGELVWSGACEFHNSNVFDFKTWTKGNSTNLSFILFDRSTPHSFGVVMNEHFDREKVRLDSSSKGFNMHEFTVTDGGERALMLVGGRRLVDSSLSSASSNLPSAVWDGALIDLDMKSRKPILEWKFLDHIPLGESTAEKFHNHAKEIRSDWAHPNSIDKDDKGDYLISARHTDTVYKISGKDGSILWKLGGKNSSFVLNGFNFTRQHHARFQGRNGNRTLISLLNNAGDMTKSSGMTSAGYLIELDTEIEPMTATLVNQWLRPDHGRTRLRGNVQLLGNGNTFVSWSENGYITEYDPEGNIVLDTQFMLDRLATYRAFKFDFVGRPRYPPAVKAIANELEADAITSIYVSWNGATDIDHWDFYGGTDLARANFTFIGTKKKVGFETVLVAPSYLPYVYAEGFDSNGQKLGVSNLTLTIKPISWNASKVADLLQSHQRHLRESSENASGQNYDQTSSCKLSSRSGFNFRLLGSNVYALAAGVLLGVTMAWLFLFFSRRKVPLGRSPLSQRITLDVEDSKFQVMA